MSYMPNQPLAVCSIDRTITFYDTQKSSRHPYGFEPLARCVRFWKNENETKRLTLLRIVFTRGGSELFEAYLPPSIRPHCVM
jgi:hypothetical protein